MAVKHKIVTLDHSATSFLNNEIYDFLVNDCGWTDDTPSGQDDDFNFGLGYFLSSPGEDGNTKIHMHLWGAGDDNSYVPPIMTYLGAAITTTGQMSCTVLDGTLLPSSGPFWIRIDDELIICSGTSGSTVTFSQRGAGGTTAATHAADACVGLENNIRSCIELFMHQDVSSGGGIAAASASSPHARDNVSALAGLTGYGDRRFNYHAFLRITSGSESGKMRPILDYDDTGDFTYRPFLNAPGDNTSEVVMAGFNPACSWRMCDTSFSSNDMCHGSIERNSVGDATTFFMYGSKDGFVIVAKYNSAYYAHYFGNVVPYASKLTTALTAGASAGATSFVVANRHLFVEGEKYRLLSTDVDDWGDNEDRSAEAPASSWPDLDPEEIPSEEVVVDTITPGTGDAGTIAITSQLIYSYRTGAEVGEDPRPAVRVASQGGTFADPLVGGQTMLPLYLNTRKENLAIDASHRQNIRACHNTSSRWIPYPGYFDFMRYNSELLVGPSGAQSGSGPDSPSYLTQRYVGGLISVYTPYNATYRQYGRWECVKGTLPYIWWFNVTGSSPPYGGSAEDTLKAWWGSQFETFRMFQSPGSGTHWFACGPEL